MAEHSTVNVGDAVSVTGVVLGFASQSDGSRNVNIHTDATGLDIWQLEKFLTVTTPAPEGEVTPPAGRPNPPFSDPNVWRATPVDRGNAVPLNPNPVLRVPATGEAVTSERLPELLATVEAAIEAVQAEIHPAPGTTLEPPAGLL